MTLFSTTATSCSTVPVTVAASTTTHVCVMPVGLESTVLHTRVSVFTTAATTASVWDRISASVTLAGWNPTAAKHPAHYRTTAPTAASAHYLTCE